MNAQPLQLRCEDGVLLSAQQFGSGTAGAVVIAPALGVPQSFYAAFAADLAGRGFRVLSFDYRGFAASAAAVPGDRVVLADCGRQDLEAALRHALGWNRDCALVGHSLGGQMLGLAPSARRLRAAVLVACTAPHLRHYPPAQRPGLGLLWHLMIPLLARGRPTLPPQRIGLGKGPALPTGMLRDWAAWARSRHYLFDPRHRLDLSGYRELRAPLLAWRFADDPYAPRRAVDALLRQFPAAAIDCRGAEGLSPRPVGHFGFFREAERDTLWRATADWLVQQLDAAKASPAATAAA